MGFESIVMCTHCDFLVCSAQGLITGTTGLIALTLNCNTIELLEVMQAQYST